MQSDNENPRTQRVVLIQEGLVALTGHHISAILLGQLLYWQRRVSDVDDYLEEESLRRSAAQEPELPDIKSHGWIYKSAKQLTEETMLAVDEELVRRYLKKLVDDGWVAARRNPRRKDDRTLQYRCDIPRIQVGLHRIGFGLNDYKLSKTPTITHDDSTPCGSIPHSVETIPESTSETSKNEPRPSFATLTTDVERSEPSGEAEAPVKCAPDVNVVLAKMKDAHDKHVTADVDSSECWTLALHLYQLMWGYKMSPGDKRNIGGKMKRYGENLVAKGIYKVWASGNWPKEIEYIWATIDSEKQDEVYQQVKKDNPIILSHDDAVLYCQKIGCSHLDGRALKRVNDANGNPILGRDGKTQWEKLPLDPRKWA